jgi:hypothetical protein
MEHSNASPAPRSRAPFEAERGRYVTEGARLEERPPLLYQVDDCEPCSFVDWYEANADTMSHEEVAAVGMLRPGESITFGGGAAAESIVRAVDPSAPRCPDCGGFAEPFVNSEGATSFAHRCSVRGSEERP